MHTLTKLILATVAIILMSACAPMTKESYLNRFDAFVTEISVNSKSYSDKDWQKMSEKYDKFSGEWYEKFKNEFTLKEQIKIKANQGKWLYYSNLNAATSTFKKLFESLDIKGMKKQIQYYIDNNMQSDLQKFYEDATKAGKDAQDAVTEILNELNIKLDEWQK